MSELNYVELPVIRWLSGQGSTDPTETGLGWTYRDAAEMDSFDRPLEDPIVEKLLFEAIIRINPDVTTEAQAQMAIATLRKAMAHPDKLTANQDTLNLLREGASVDSCVAKTLEGQNNSVSEIQIMQPLQKFG